MNAMQQTPIRHPPATRHRRLRRSSIEMQQLAKNSKQKSYM